MGPVRQKRWETFSAKREALSRSSNGTPEKRIGNEAIWQANENAAIFISKISRRGFLGSNNRNWDLVMTDAKCEGYIRPANGSKATSNTIRDGRHSDRN